MTVFPVWKDTEITLTGSSTYTDYVLRNDDTGEIFFTGRAYVLPNTYSATFNINKVIQSQLVSRYEPNQPGVWYHDTTASLRFSVLVGGVTQHECFTWMDYSYDSIPIAPTMLINSPVKGIYDINGKCIISIVNTSQNGSNVEIKMGSTTVFSGVVSGMGIHHYEIPSNKMTEGVLTVKVGNVQKQFRVETTCKPYELIYKNKIGGYDTLVINGNAKKTDTWTHYNINRSFKNTTLEFEQAHYLLDMQEKYVFHTGRISENEVERLANLFQSTRMYLLEHSTGKIIPIVITDTQMEHLTFQNNGYRLVQFTINASASQSKVVR